MSAMNDGGPAFPVPPGRTSITGDPRDGVGYEPAIGGMSLRDYFAGQALAGMCFRESWFSYEDVAASAYRMADTMLKEREK